MKFFFSYEIFFFLRPCLTYSENVSPATACKKRMLHSCLCFVCVLDSAVLVAHNQLGTGESVTTIMIVSIRFELVIVSKWVA